MSRSRRIAQTMALLALPAASACVSSPKAPVMGPAAASELESHITGFAMVHCLRALGDKGLPEPDARVLRQQGDRWGQVLVERSRGDIFAAFEVLLPALDAALAATPMAMVRDDATGGSLPAPLFHCVALLRQPAVEAAMSRARATLAPAYAQALPEGF